MRANTTSIEATIAITMPRSMPSTSVAPNETPRPTRSERFTRAMWRISCTSTRLMTATMMVAPSAAWGSDANTGVRNNTVGMIEQRCDDRCERRAGAGAVAHRCPGEAAGDRHAAEDAGCDVGHAEADELLVGVDLVAVSAGVDLGNGDRLHEADEGDRDRCGDEGSHRAAVERRDREAGERAGDLADGADATVVEIEQVHGADRRDQHEQRTGTRFETRLSP